MSKPLVVKVGGAILENSQALAKLFQHIHQLAPQKVVLVHGGGCVVDEQLSKQGLVSEKHQGLRVTPASHIPVVAGALSGFVNKTLVVSAESQGLKACGISLLDGQMTTATLLDEKLGAVGKIQANSSKLLDALLAADILPVVASIAALENGQLVNVNADDAAVAIAELLNAELLLLSDVNGVKGADGEYLTQLDQQLANELIAKGVIAGGMIAKVNAALHAAQTLRRSIAVASWQQPQQLAGLAKGNSIGTRILAS